MKRYSLLILSIVILLSAFAVAESISNTLPSKSIWGTDKETLKNMLQNYKACKVEDDDAIIVSNQTINP